MNVGSICSRHLVTISRSGTLQQAGALMREHHVGALAVTETRPEGVHVVGIVTDRDLAIEVLARGFDGQSMEIGQLLDGRVVSAPQEASLMEAIELMQIAGVRRLLVRSEDRQVVGVVSFDDLLEACVVQLNSLASVLGKGIERETVERSTMASPSKPTLLIPAMGAAAWSL